MEEESSNSKFFLYSVLFLLIVLIALGGLYFYLKYGDGEEIGSEATILNRDVSSKEQIDRAELDSKDEQIRQLKAQAEALKNDLNSVPNKIKYTIKPKDKIVSECYDVPMASWSIPKHCRENLARNIKEFLDNDKKIVAFEVVGIVDNTSYSGDRKSVV